MPPQAPNPQDDRVYSPSQSSRFDFILNPKQVKKPAPFSGLPRSVLILILVVVGLFGFLFISSFLHGRGGQHAKDMVNLAARQQEIIRVTELAKKNMSSNDLYDLANTIETNILSDQKRLLVYMKGQHYKYDKKSLAAAYSTTTNQNFATAVSNHTTDQTYISYISKALTNYQQAIEQVYQATGPRGQLILTDSFNSAKLEATSNLLSNSSNS